MLLTYPPRLDASLSADDVVGQSIIDKAAASCTPVIDFIGYDLATKSERVFHLATRITYSTGEEGSGNEILGVIVWETPTAEIGRSLLPYSMTPDAIEEGVGDQPVLIDV